MADQYVFELQFKGGSVPKENQFVIVDRSSMEDFSKLKDDLGKCTSGLLNVQYVDDEDDVIAIDSEEEFKEFAKLAKHRSSKGLLTKLILESNTEKKMKSNKKDSGVYNPTVRLTDLCMDRKRPIKLGSENKKKIGCKEASENPSTSSMKYSWKNFDSDPTEELKSKIVSELKQVVQSEVARQVAASQRFELAAAGPLDKDEVEEFDENDILVQVVEKRNNKVSNAKKKLEKKEKTAELQIDQRLEKLEQKKRKLLEKASLRTANRKSVVEIGFGLPCIMSAIATKDSLTLNKRVTIGKAFLHVWHVKNDGTLPWNNVELRHTWSSPGLEPDELFVKCLQLFPGQDGQIAMKFKAPKSVGNFISYWHFFYQVDSQWQQFGHFISLTGNTKLSKHSTSTSTATAKTSEVNMNSSDKSLPKAIKFSENLENAEVNLLVEDSKTKTAKQLASAEIAADMAREAANAAFRSAIGKQAAANTIKPSVMDQFEKCLDGIIELNLVDSESETDANNDESDPGFVFVDVPSAFVEDKEESEGEGPSPTKDFNQTSETNEDLLSLDDKIEKMMNYVLFDTENNCSELLSLIDQKETMLNRSKVGKHTDPEHTKGTTGFNVRITTKETPFLTSEQNENGEENKPSPEEPTQPMSFPRLDPNVNYTVFPPQRPNFPLYQQMNMFPPPSTFKQNGIPTAQPNAVFVPPPQNMSPQMVFPPAPPVAKDVGLSQFPTGQVQPPSRLPPGFDGKFSDFVPAPKAPNAPYFNHYITSHPPTVHCQMSYPFSTSGPPPVNPSFPVAVAQHTNGPTGNFQIPTCYNILSGLKAAESTSTGSKAADTPDTPTATTTPTTTELAINGSETIRACKQQPEKPSEVKEVQPERAAAENNDNKSDPIVQILPQGLVDGAINVAASAYSTAWNALNNLRTNEGKEIEFDPVFENNMALLVEMGFNNLERNARLLKRFNNDISQVIGVICATGGAHNLDID